MSRRRKKRIRSFSYGPNPLLPETLAKVEPHKRLTATEVDLPRDLPLAELEDIVASLQARLLNTVRTAVYEARALGIALILVKKKVGHGEFELWLQNQNHFRGSPRTARRYMLIAKRWKTKDHEYGDQLNNHTCTLTRAERILRCKVPSDQEGEKAEEPTATKKVKGWREFLIKELTGDAANSIRRWYTDELEQVWQSGRVLESVLRQLGRLSKKVASPQALNATGLKCPAPLVW